MRKRKGTKGKIKGRKNKKEERRNQGEVSDSHLISYTECGRNKQKAIECGNSQYLWTRLLQTLFLSPEGPQWA